MEKLTQAERELAQAQAAIEFANNGVIKTPADFDKAVTLLGVMVDRADMYKRERDDHEARLLQEVKDKMDLYDTLMKPRVEAVESTQGTLRDKVKAYLTANRQGILGKGKSKKVEGVKVGFRKTPAKLKIDIPKGKESKVLAALRNNLGAKAVGHFFRDTVEVQATELKKQWAKLDKATQKQFIESGVNVEAGEDVFFVKVEGV